MLANREVVQLDALLRPLDGFGEHFGFQRLIFGPGLEQRAVAQVLGEQAHQLVVQREIKPRLARVALSPRASAQLVVDASALVAFRAQHEQPAEFAHLFGSGGAFLLG